MTDEERKDAEEYYKICKMDLESDCPSEGSEKFVKLWDDVKKLAALQAQNFHAIEINYTRAIVKAGVYGIMLKEQCPELWGIMKK